jgi:hypothetical protein
MATPFPNSKIELHQWANSILLGMVSFFVIQTYNTITSDHEVLAKHETRISVLEATKQREKQTSYSTFDAILPERIKVKKD